MPVRHILYSCEIRCKFSLIIMMAAIIVYLSQFEFDCYVIAIIELTGFGNITRSTKRSNF